MASALVRTGCWVLVRCHRHWILCSPTTVSASGKTTSTLFPHEPQVVTADPRALTYSGDAIDRSLMLNSLAQFYFYLSPFFFYLFKSSPCCAQNGTVEISKCGWTLLCPVLSKALAQGPTCGHKPQGDQR